MNIKTPILEIKNLNVSINDKKILNDLNLTINKGEIHAIMGPNGSGKSTFSKVIAGHPTYNVLDGKIVFKGKNIINLEPEIRSHLGIFLAFQYPIEIPGVTNLEFLTLAHDLKKEAQSPNFGLSSKNFESMVFENNLTEIIMEKQKVIDMSPDFLTRNLNEGFSGGEKKRNEILQMLVLDPDLSILDETDSGLDIDALKIISNGINRFMHKDKAIILITHYQRLLDYIKPNYVHVMQNGRIIKTGSADLAKELEMVRNKAHQWNRANNNRMDKMNKSLPSIIGTVVGQIELAQDTIKRQI